MWRALSEEARSKLIAYTCETGDSEFHDADAAATYRPCTCSPRRCRASSSSLSRRRCCRDISSAVYNFMKVAEKYSRGRFRASLPTESAKGEAFCSLAKFPGAREVADTQLEP
jgi:hypothetical protein